MAQVGLGAHEGRVFGLLWLPDLKVERCVWSRSAPERAQAGAFGMLWLPGLKVERCVRSRSASERAKACAFGMLRLPDRAVVNQQR